MLLPFEQPLAKTKLLLLLQLLDPRLVQFTVRTQYRAIERVRRLAESADTGQDAAHALAPPQSLGHARFAQPAALKSRNGGDRFVIGDPRDVVKPDGAKRGDGPIGRDRDDIQIATI